MASTNALDNDHRVTQTLMRLITGLYDIRFPLAKLRIIGDFSDQGNRLVRNCGNLIPVLT